MTVSAAERKRLPASKMGMPGQNKYPMPDKNHARVAKSYASKEKNRGNLSDSAYNEIISKANKILGKSGKGKAKGKKMPSDNDGDEG